MGRAELDPGGEIVAYQILVATQQAVRELQSLNIKQKEASISAKQLKADVAAIGKADTSGISRLNKAWQELKMRMDVAKLANQSANATMNQTTASATKAASGLSSVATSANKAKEGFFSLNNVARTAFGTFTAMAIFLVTKFVGDAFAKVIDSLKQVELSFYRIGQSEKALSLAGVEVTFQDIQGIADRLVETFNFISKIDAQKLVGKIVGSTSELDLTLEQLEQIAQIIPVLARRKDISTDQAFQEFINGFTSSGKGWKDLWIPTDVEIIKDKAIELQLVADAEAFALLTGEQKQNVEVQALLAIAFENTKDEIDEMGKGTDSFVQNQGILKAAWEDFTAKVGTIGAPLIISSLKAIIKVVEFLSMSFDVVRLTFIAFIVTTVGGLYAMGELLKGNVHNLKEFVDAFNRAGDLAFVSALNMTGGPKAGADTPTGTPPVKDSGAVENAEDIAGALEKANEEIIKAELKLKQDLQDIAIDLGRKMVDITAEYAKKRADAYADYNEKIGDINRDFNRKLEDIAIKASESRAKHQADQLEKEREFQNKLQEMREEFLMDLDDALHARDARQILKLIKQYNLEKLQAERKHALDMENSQKDEELRQQSYANERKQAEKERRAKLEDAQRDYQLKLAKLKADEDAEVAAAVLAANRKTEDLMKANQDRLAIIAADLVNQFNLTKAGLDAVLNLYRAYYGAGGYISQVMAGMQMSMNGFRNNGVVPSTQINNPTRGSGGGRMAEGGTMLANKPTTVTFGEAGLEMAYFKPIGRNGKDENKIFSSLGGGGGGNNGGLVSIELLLSPDLESRITRNTLGQAAEIVMRTSRSKG